MPPRMLVLLPAVALLAVACDAEPAGPAASPTNLANGVYAFTQTVSLQAPGVSEAICTSAGDMDLQFVPDGSGTSEVIGRLERIVTCVRDGVNIAGYQDLSLLSGTVMNTDLMLAEPDARVLGNCTYQGMVAEADGPRVAGGTVACTRVNAASDIVSTAGGTWEIERVR